MSIILNLLFEVAKTNLNYKEFYKLIFMFALSLTRGRAYELQEI